MRSTAWTIAIDVYKRQTLDHPNAVLHECPLQPSPEHCRIQRLQQPMLPRKRKRRMPVDRTNRIVDTLYVAESVVVEVRLRDLGRPQMHKHRTHPAIRKLLLQVRHVADGPAAEGAAEVTQEDQQHRRSLRQHQQVRARLRMNRGQHLRRLVD